MNDKKILKHLEDAIPSGPHPEPHAEWINVRLDVVQGAIDAIEWTNKGNAEWRDIATTASRQLRATQATARIAIAHLQGVLNQARTHDEQQVADTSARDWLISIGSEPGAKHQSPPCEPAAPA